MKSEIRKMLHALGNPEKGIFAQVFFKTKKGQYAEGDKFLGITVPEQRKLVKQFRDLPEEEIIDLLHNEWHEERLVALLILVDQFERGDADKRQHIYKLYLSSTKYINNWDLVDTSAHKIVGAYLLEKPREILRTLARSQSLWERRISIVATHAFIAHDQFQDTFAICELLLKDPHDLIHKACGWMLREVGKRQEGQLKEFLKKQYQHMPRTMLRYAIERFDPELRRQYLQGNI